MAKTAIYSPHVGRPRSPIAHAVRTGDLLFVSGAAPYDINLKIAKGDFSAQMRQCMDNLVNVLKAGGSDYPYPLYVKAGVDLAQPQPYRALMDRMNRLIDEYERLASQTGRR